MTAWRDTPAVSGRKARKPCSQVEEKSAAGSPAGRNERGRSAGQVGRFGAKDGQGRRNLRPLEQEGGCGQQAEDSQGKEQPPLGVRLTPGGPGSILPIPAEGDHLPPRWGSRDSPNRFSASGIPARRRRTAGLPGPTNGGHSGYRCGSGLPDPAHPWTCAVRRAVPRQLRLRRRLRTAP